MENIRKFLESPDENRDEFWESEDLVWIDWREDDESIIEYFNEKLLLEDNIQFECVEIEKERGIDIILKKDGSVEKIPYEDDFADRDTTLKSIQNYVSPKYQVRWYMDSLGSDTLAFCIKLSLEWENLEKEFGVEKVRYYFEPIDNDLVMFEMSIDEVFDLIEEREK